MKIESEFEWACPTCNHTQTERVTEDGPVMSLICENGHEFDERTLPKEITEKWHTAIDEVIPR